MIIATLTIVAVACTQTHAQQVTQATSGTKIVLNGGQTGQIRHFRAAQPNSNITARVLISDWFSSNTATHSPEVAQITSGKQIILIGGAEGFWNRIRVIQSSEIPPLLARVTQYSREALFYNLVPGARVTQEAREVLNILPGRIHVTQVAREVIAIPGTPAAWVRQSQEPLEYAHDSTNIINHTQSDLEYIWRPPNTTIESQVVLEIAYHYEPIEVVLGNVVTQVAIESLTTIPEGPGEPPPETGPEAKKGQNIMIYHIG